MSYYVFYAIFQFFFLVKSLLDNYKQKRSMLKNLNDQIHPRLDLKVVLVEVSSLRIHNSPTTIKRYSISQHLVLLNKLPKNTFSIFFFSALSCKRKYLSCQSNRQSTSNWSPSKFFSTDLCIFIRKHTQLLELSVNTKKVFIHEKLCNCAISYATQSEY